MPPPPGGPSTRPRQRAGQRRSKRGAMRPKHARLRFIAGSAVISLLTATVAAVGLAPSASAADGPNLAAGKTVSASSYSDVYRPANANDGSQATYWESANNAFPQWIQ